MRISVGYIRLIIGILICQTFHLTSAQDLKYTPQYADSCYLKGIVEFSNQNYQAAKLQFERSLEVNDSVKRNEPYLSSNAIYWISHILYIEGNKKDAQDLTADYCFLPVDQRNTYKSDSLWVLSSKSTDIRKSLYYAKRARDIEITNLGHEHYYIANSDQHIASMYMQLEQWDSAKYFQEEAIGIFERCMDKDFTPNYIIALLEYIRTSVHLSDINSYRSATGKIKNAVLKLYDKTSYSYAYTFYELSRANMYFGDFVDCISNAKEAASVYYQLLPSKEMEMQLSLCYQLLGNTYGRVNNFQEAKSYLQQANDIFEKNKSIGDEILFDIAYYQGKCGEYEDAIVTYKKLINLLGEYFLHNVSNREHTQRLLISSYLDIAELFYDKKNVDSAFVYAEKGLSLAKTYNNRSKQLEALQTLSVCYFEKSLYEKAIEMQEYILKEDSNNITNLYNLMWSYYAIKNKDEFYKCAIRYYSFEKNNILSTFSRIYEKTRWEYLKEGEFRRFQYPLRFAHYYNNDNSICSLAYNCELFRKGLLLTSSIEFSRIIGECDKKVQNDYQYLLKIRERLNHPISDKERIDLLEKEQQIEGALLKQVPNWAVNIKQLDYSWKDIQSNLKEHEIAIEFAEYSLDAKREMLALVIRSGWNSPRCIVLDEFDSNDNRIRNFNNSAFSDTSLSKSVWGKILTEVQVQDHETVYFAADGAFRVFPIEHLCNPDNPEQTISNRINIVRLSSTREICRLKDNDEMLSISLYGNLLYDIPEERKIENSRKYFPSQYCFDDNKQSPLMGDSMRAGYKYLYWTKAEIDSIEHYATNNMPQMLIAKYELDTGTEESFKELSKKSPSIIHLATHAFYYNDRSHGTDRKTEGLLFAGCNTICNDSLSVEDGILCSSEIELLNLRNTSLIVLSGCNTGLGNQTIDGIGGLQRAFKKAGVGTIIMSLWEISDLATSYFMQNFYRELFLTKSKKKAFFNAQQLTKKQFEAPFYWASFIMLD